MKNQEPNFRDIYKEFHGQMDKPGFRPIIRSASILFDAPVIFTDEKYQLVSLYPAVKINDYVYDTLLEEGELPDETIAAFHKAYLRKPGRRYEPFFEKSGLVKDCPRIFAEIYDDDKVYGHVAVLLKDREFENWQLEATSILTDILRIKIKLSKQLLSLRSDTLNDLLNRDTTKQASNRIIQHLFKGEQKPSLLLVAPLDQTKSQHAFASLAINYLMHKFTNAIPIIYHDDLVVLLTRESRMPELMDTAEKISDYLNQYQILCGGVYPVNDLHNLPDHYLQGRMTAIYRYWSESRNRELPSKMLYYHDTAPTPLFLYLSRKSETRCFLHPSLEEIQQYDVNNETDYYNTIISYCRHLFQKNETAEALHIHRNTLNYRLDRIKEIFGLDLQEYETVLHLMMSSEMIHFYD